MSKMGKPLQTNQNALWIQRIFSAVAGIIIKCYRIRQYKKWQFPKVIPHFNLPEFSKHVSLDRVTFFPSDANWVEA